MKKYNTKYPTPITALLPGEIYVSNGKIVPVSNLIFAGLIPLSISVILIIKGIASAIPG